MKLFDLVGLGVPFYLGAGHSFLETYDVIAAIAHVPPAKSKCFFSREAPYLGMLCVLTC